MARGVKKQADAGAGHSASPLAAPVDDASLSAVRAQFEEYSDATIACRELAEKCRDYRDGNQWTDTERDTLKKRKQPCITDNKIQDKCDTLLGLEKQMRTDPKAYPRTPKEEQSAEAATDSLRYVADSSDYQRTVRKPAADNLMVEGLCFGQVIVEAKRAAGGGYSSSGGYGHGKGGSGGKSKHPRVCLEHIRWDRGYYDIHSLRDDFADKTYCGYFTWLDYDVAKSMFKAGKHVHEDALEHLEATFSGALSGPEKTFDDKPRYKLSLSGRKRVQVFYHYRKIDGVWNEGVWCRGGWLETERPCAYKDEFGEPDCCLEIQALYRDSEGNPYGSVQRYLDPQDEHNKRRSKMLHLLNAKRVIVQSGQVDDIAKIRAEVHKPDGVIEVPSGPDSIRIEDNLSEANSQFTLLQYTDAQLSQTGPNAALAGLSGSISGRAKQLDQGSGMVAVSPLFEALESWEVRMYRQAWCRVRQYWTEEMWVRVTDDEEKLKFVPLNRRLTKGDVVAQQLAKEQMPDEQKAQIIQQMAADPTMGEPAVDPQTGKPMMQNELAVMDVDIIIDRAPDVVNIQQEQFEIIARIAESRPEVPFEAVIEASQLRSDQKRKITSKLSGEDNPMAKQMAAMQEQMAAIAQEQAAAKVRETTANAALKEAQAAQTQAETVSTGLNAATQLASASSAAPERPERRRVSN